MNYQFTCEHCGHKEEISDEQLRALIAQNRERGIPMVNKLAASFQSDEDGRIYVRRTQDAEC